MCTSAFRAGSRYLILPIFYFRPEFSFVIVFGWFSLRACLANRLNHRSTGVLAM
jgi:hypothetical protein